MSNNFYILVIVVLAAVVLISRHLLRLLMKEYALYKLFSSNDWSREQLARDPSRFHTSIIYLMAYMMRTDGDSVQYDKLDLIARYIREVCPESCRKCCADALDYMTKRVKKSGKHFIYYPIVNTEALLFTEDNDAYFFMDRGGRYENDLHGRRLAEEIAHHLDEPGRMYLMYLLFRLAIADGDVTMKDKSGYLAELSMLKKLCVRGMHIPEAEFTQMFESWKADDIDGWYEKHIASHGHGLYADQGSLANLFHSTCSFSQLENDIYESSVFPSIKPWILGACIAVGLLACVVLSYDRALMEEYYPSGLFYVLLFFVALTFVLMVLLSPLNSSILPILRTKYENVLQRNRLIIISVAIIGTTFLLFFNATNYLYLLANETYICKVVNKKAHITRAYTTTTRSKHGTTTHYHIAFETVEVDDVRGSTLKIPVMSIPNKLCVNVLPYLSCAKYFGRDKHYKSMSRLTTSYANYNKVLDNDVDIELMFKVGCYGLVYYSGYELIPAFVKREIPIEPEY